MTLLVIVGALIGVVLGCAVIYVIATALHNRAGDRKFRELEQMRREFVSASVAAAPDVRAAVEP